MSKRSQPVVKVVYYDIRGTFSQIATVSDCLDLAKSLADEGATIKEIEVRTSPRGKLLEWYPLAHLWNRQTEYLDG